MLSRRRGELAPPSRHARGPVLSAFKEASNERFARPVSVFQGSGAASPGQCTCPPGSVHCPVTMGPATSSSKALEREGPSTGEQGMREETGHNPRNGQPLTAGDSRTEDSDYGDSFIK